jgi:DNA-binding HxlR family transcriptional regulator
LIATADDGYRLSERGRSLGELLLPLDAWARRWKAARS